MTKTNDYNTKGFVSHIGFVSKISKEVVEISLLGNVHCEACNAKSACGVSDDDTKIIKTYNKNQSLHVNEKVEIVMENSLGLKAVFYGYVLPFILLFTVLFVSSLYIKEWQAGLFSLFVLVPYYFALYYSEKVFQKTFSITVLKHS